MYIYLGWTLYIVIGAPVSALIKLEHIAGRSGGFPDGGFLAWGHLLPTWSDCQFTSAAQLDYFIYFLLGSGNGLGQSGMYIVSPCLCTCTDLCRLL